MPKDPIAQFGHDAVELIFGLLEQVPEGSRTQVLEQILKQIDSSGKLWENVKEVAKKSTVKLGSEGFAAALAAGLADFYVHAMYRAGRGDLSALSGLGCGGCCADCEKSALGGLQFTLDPRKIFSSQGILAKGIGGVGSLVGTAINGISSLACKLTQNPLGQVAAAGAGSLIGGAAGLAAVKQGTQIAGNLCGGGQPAPPPPPQTPPWVLPVAIGGGTLILALILTR